MSRQLLLSDDTCEYIHTYRERPKHYIDMHIYEHEMGATVPILAKTNMHLRMFNA